MSSEERRNFFRLTNSVYVGYRKASEDELQDYLKNEAHIKPDSLDITYQLDQISRQMTPLLIDIRQESLALAQYVDLLNQKIDLMSSIVAFQQFKLETKSECFESTETLDISEGGFSFNSKQQLALNSHLCCKIAIVGYRLGMDTFAKVVRCDPVSEVANNYRIAVELPYLKEVDRKNLTRFIFDKQREQLRNRSTD